MCPIHNTSNEVDKTLNCTCSNIMYSGTYYSSICNDTINFVYDYKNEDLKKRIYELNQKLKQKG